MSYIYNLYLDILISVAMMRILKSIANNSDENILNMKIKISEQFFHIFCFYSHIYVCMYVCNSYSTISLCMCRECICMFVSMHKYVCSS